jgi:hypothetical protein
LKPLLAVSLNTLRHVSPIFLPLSLPRTQEFGARNFATMTDYIWAVSCGNGIPVFEIRAHMVLVIKAAIVYYEHT